MPSLQHVQHLRTFSDTANSSTANAPHSDTPTSPTRPMNPPNPQTFTKLRFVSNESGPYAKRRRINTACQTCRKRKTRCSGERPVCASCSQHNYPCSYGDADNTLTSPNTEGPTLERSQSSEKAKAEPTSPTKPDALRSPAKRRFSDETFRRPAIRQNSNAESPVEKHAQAGTAMTPTSNKTGAESSTPGSKKTKPYEDPIIDDDSGRPLLSLSTRNRMPYFRYFGPTAIMPGFKQMVVKVRNKHDEATTSSDAVDSPANNLQSTGSTTQTQTAETKPVDIPIYDNSNVAPPPLITHLCNLFFTHLGCNFPFLQKDRFMRDLEEKQVDSILVDAVCAMAARFSSNPVLADLKEHPEGTHISPSEYGQAFAARAKSVIADTFGCPSVAVVQAALLLAYDEFGANRDSGLWMYLGIAIRMAQDLGMQKLEGLRYEGRWGPTPKSVKHLDHKGKKGPRAHQARKSTSSEPADPQAESEIRAAERERIDTFWAVFFLDRVISSGTGRPVTLRDRDIEISFPSLDEVDKNSGWPVPFPPLIRIIHLYGRVTDLLNGIEEVSHVTQDVIKRLAAMESQLTDIYQGLSLKLHFNAPNLQQYVKDGQGTTFILLHFWFHTLIVLLHQPTLLHTFEGKIQQLLPNSRELSMSSAKTIADMLAFAELIDAKSGLGNPFTSQPIYIAACAFLRETALHTASNPNSRGDSPEPRKTKAEQPNRPPQTIDPNDQRLSTEEKQNAKSTLLASNANQNYQRCYRALQSLETYWAGVKYILTVLDQKSKGVMDPLLYTDEEMESALERPRPEPAFTSPGWRRKLSWGSYLTAPNTSAVTPGQGLPGLQASGPGNDQQGTDNSAVGSPPMLDPHQAIGWSLSGMANSPSTSLAVLYPTDNNGHRRSSQGKNQKAPRNLQPQQMSMSSNSAPATATLPPGLPNASFPFSSPQPLHTAMAPPNAAPIMSPNQAQTPHSQQGYQPLSSDPPLMSDADLLLNLGSRFPSPSPGLTRVGSSATGTPSNTTGGKANPFTGSSSTATSPPGRPGPSQQDFHHMQLAGGPYNPPMVYGGMPGQGMGGGTMGNSMFADMMIESQEMDLSDLSGDMMPWLEYLPHDMLYFDSSGGNTNPGPGDGRGGNGGR